MQNQANITAAQFEKRYGKLVREEYADLGYRALSTALLARQPPIDVPRGVLEQWLKRKSIKPPDSITVSSTNELEEKYGAVVRLLVAEHATAYKLCKALRSQTPAVYCTDGIAKEWINKFGTPLQRILTAGHLELICGARIREAGKWDLEAPDLKVWIQTQYSIEASESTCQVWRSTVYSTSGKILSIDAVEEQIGERLRLSQYEDQFTEDLAPTLAEVLQESQPSVLVAPLLLRQWYTKFHLDSGPLHIHSAEGLEQYLGDDIRMLYPYFTAF